MCGITGYINLSGKPIENTKSVLSMLYVQKHRGPDDSGLRIFNLESGQSAEMGVANEQKVDGNFNGILGFNRLSILDLSFNGHQPMVTRDNKIFLTLNGEIYNAFDFKHELETWGYQFRSTTDTEIVLALYLKYGFDGMLNRLNGMFAIVIVDLHRSEVFITRDHFGIKPMYYIFTDQIFAFSSEIKSFKYLEDFTFRLREEQLDEYLLFRNNFHGTLFRDIESVVPGHYLSYTMQGGLKKKRFFNPNDFTRNKSAGENLEHYAENLEAWLKESVKSQLMSDVKLGCQLSGGIDSSLVTWLAKRTSDKGQFETVSIIFNDIRYSEERYIDRVTDKLKIVSHKFLLDTDYYLNNFERATWHLESPINHPNTVAIYKLSQLAKQYVTVLLSGEGADEVFGGYERYYYMTYPLYGKRMLQEIRKNINSPLVLYKYLDQAFRAVMATAFMTPTLATSVMNEFSTERAITTRRDLYNSVLGSRFDRQVKYEMQSYLPDLLIRQDKMSMAHSIENRVPFLDKQVVENSFLIPEKFLLMRKSPEGYNTEKYLLKKITAKLFGNDFAFRNKMGFSIPLREYFADPGFKLFLSDRILAGVKERGIFNHRLVSEWLSNLKNASYHEMEALWVVVTFELWASIYLDGNYETRNS